MNLLWPFPGNPRISAGFDQKRPLGDVPKTHIHGAIDIPGELLDPVIAPENGIIMAMKNWRPADKSGKPWPDSRMDIFPYHNYFNDMYGPIVILKGDSGYVHIFAHSYWKRILSVDWAQLIEWNYMEEKADARWPFHSDYSTWTKVYRGEKITSFGNAGYTMGCHVHYEIHPNYKWYTYKKRIDPEKIKWENRV